MVPTASGAAYPPGMVGRTGLVSVVIPVRDGAATLPRQLDALVAQRTPGDWEVVIADNGSTDSTVRVAQSYADRLPIRVVDVSERIGINAARNGGVRAAAGEFVCLCDADDEVAPGWVHAMRTAAPGHGGVGGRLDERSLNDADAAAWRPWSAQDGLPVALGFLPFAVGANCGFWRAVFDELGGFDERYVRGGADVEFFWRVQLAGHRLAFAPGAVVAYRHRAGLRATARQFWRYGMADAQLYQNFRQHGVPRDTAHTVWRAWRMVAVDGLRSHRTESRGRAVRTAAYRLGRLRGSLRQRVLFP